MLVPDKIYKVFTKFFITITVEVKFDFIQMGFIQTSMIGLAILSSGNSELGSFVPTWKIM